MGEESRPPEGFYEDSDQNSMFFWYPKIKDLDIPQPKTIMVEIPLKEKAMEKLCDMDFSVLEPFWEQILAAGREIGYPLFLRTDELSNKHDWEKSCYVAKEEDLKPHIANLIEMLMMADIMGLPFRGLVFREYIEMNSKFKAFYGKMPVNPERRYFVDKGKLVCEHWYWIEDAIEQGSPEGLLPKDWKDLLKSFEHELTSEEMNLLEEHALKVAAQFDGYFSVDFCKGRDGTWYLIDMARGVCSWHPDDCEHHPHRRQENERKKKK